MVSEQLLNNIMILYVLVALGQGNIINVKRLLLEIKNSLRIRKWESLFY